MTPEEAKAAAAVVCRAIDYYRAVGTVAQAQVEERMAQAFERMDAEEPTPAKKP